MTTKNRKKKGNALKNTPLILERVNQTVDSIMSGEASPAPALEQLAADPMQPAESPRRRNRNSAPKVPMRDVEIPEALLRDSQRMIFVLLLALLSNADGEVAFTEEQLDIDDTAYNVVFARTIDSKKLIVSVVSNQSGILRTPAAGQDTVRSWTQQQEYLPPPAAEIAGPGSRETMLSAVQPGMTPQDKYLAAAAAETGASPTQQPAATERLPQSFPFETGDRPEDTRPIDLGAYAQQATRSREIEAEQAEIAARVDQQGR